MRSINCSKYTPERLKKEIARKKADLAKYGTDEAGNQNQDWVNIISELESCQYAKSSLFVVWPLTALAIVLAYIILQSYIPKEKRNRQAIVYGSVVATGVLTFVASYLLLRMTM